MTMRNEVRQFQKETVQIQDHTGVDAFGEAIYGNLRTVKCRVERDVWTKTQFDGHRRDRFTKISLYEELPRTWEGLVFIDGDTRGLRADVVRPIYDETGRFVQTVVEV